MRVHAGVKDSLPDLVVVVVVRRALEKFNH